MAFRGFGGFTTSGLIAAAILWSFATTDVELSRLMSAGPRIADFLGRMFPPDPTVMAEIKKGSAETLRIAILGTLGAVILSVPLGILASETMVSPTVFRPIRTLLAFIRAIPLILVAMLMVGAVGLGPLPGIIAVAFHATGMLAKFYAEAIDGVSRAPIAALESAGARAAQIRDLAADGAGRRPRHDFPVRVEPARVADPRHCRRGRDRFLHPDLRALFPV